MNENVLNQLAELCGIEPEYHDIWGRIHKVSNKTKSDLLRAMGLPVDDEASIHSALAEKKAVFWRRLLDTVLVVRENGSPILVTLRLLKRILKIDLNGCSGKRAGITTRILSCPKSWK
jgi:hypothetical protein